MKVTWSDRVGLPGFFDAIHPAIRVVGKVDDAVVDDGGGTAILVHACAEVPLCVGGDVVARESVDDDAAAAFGGAALDVVDAGGDGVDEELCDGGGLEGG